MSEQIVQWLAPGGIFTEPNLYGEEIRQGWWKFILVLALIFVLPAGRRAMARVTARAPLLTTVAGQLIVLLSIFFGLEVGAGRLLSRRPSPPPETNEGNYNRDTGEVHPVLGYRLKPNQRTNLSRKIYGKPIFHVRYDSDGQGRRLTSNPSRPKVKYRFVAYFGCSYTFGEAVDTAETLPSAAASLVPEHRHYNYGLSGYGPQQTLARLEAGSLRDEIHERLGTAIHVFMDGHVERAIGSMYVYGQWGPNMPYYDFDVAGELTRFGSFTTGRPWTSLVYAALGRSDLARLIGVNLPRIRDRHFRLTAAMLVRSRELFEHQFPGSRFAVMIYPGSRFGVRLKAHLPTDFPLLDYSTLIADYHESAKWKVTGDGHPSPASHVAVARALSEFLRQTSGID